MIIGSNKNAQEEIKMLRKFLAEERAYSRKLEDIISKAIQFTITKTPEEQNERQRHSTRHSR